MKKIILYITILMFAVVQIANSQTAKIVPVNGTYGTTQVDVQFSGFSPTAGAVGAITMKIGFDPTVATFTGVTYGTIISGITANAVGNEVLIAWSEINAPNINGIGFKLNFVYSGGSCDLTFNQGCEIANGSGNPIQVTMVNGAINQDLTLAAKADIGGPLSQNGVYNSVNELPIVFSGFPTTPVDALVGAISLHISYDATKLDFVGISGLSGAVANAVNGIITIAWSSTTSIDLNSVDLRLRFNYLGGTSAVNFVGTNEIIKQNGGQVSVTLLNGEISQNTSGAATVDIGEQTGSLSGNTTVPVSFSGFTENPAAITMNISYDASKLNFVGTSGLAGLISNASNGIITLAWSNSNGFNISNFNLLFSYISGYSDLNFTGQNQITGTNGYILSVNYTGGKVNQAAPAINVNLGNAAFTPGNSQVSIPLSYTGGGVYASTMYVNFDNTKLTYMGYSNAASGIIANQDYTTKTIIITYSSSGTVLPANIINLNFTFNGGAGNCDVPVTFTTFNSNASSFADVTAQPIMANLTNGNVNTKPLAFNVTGTGSYCYGGTGVVIGLDGSQNGVSYQLYNGVTPIGTAVVGDNSSISFGAQTLAGTYTVVATNGGGSTCSNNMLGTAVVTVKPLPSVTANASATSVCAGENVTLTGSGNATSYTWDNSVTDNVPFIPSVGTVDYIVTGLLNGCTATSTISVTVKPLPSVTANATSTSVCAGENVTLTGSGNATSYTWDNSVTDNVAFIPTVGTVDYIVTGLLNGCTATSTISVTVKPLPSVIANATSTSVCAGENVTLTGSGNATSYIWDNSVTDNVAFIPTVGTVDYIVTGLLNGCTATSTISVTVKPLPSVTANATSTSVCAGENVTLTGSGNATSYTWDNSVTDNVAFIPTVGTVDYIVTGLLNGCTATSTISVTVKPLPTASAGGSVNICSSNIANISGTSSSNGSILWSHNGNGTLSGETTLTPSYSPSSNDAGNSVILTMTVSSTTGCGVATAIYTINVLKYKISGYVRYDGRPRPDNLILADVTIDLKRTSDNVIVSTTTTDVNGYYEFSVSNGDYQLVASSSKPQGGVNTGDVLLLRRKTTGTFTALPNENALRLRAADVNVNGLINLGDVLAIRARALSTSSILYTAPNWLFDIPSVTVDCADVTSNFWGICSGDVNGDNNTSF